MKKRLLASLLALPIAGLLVAQAAADAIVTLSDKRVEGTIVKEDDEDLVLRTEDYGELTFKKLNLKQIIRGAGSAPVPSGGSSDPFGGSSGGANPFGESSGNADPSGGSTGGANPFGGSSGGANPFGGSSGGANPFGGGSNSDSFGADSSDTSPANPFEVGFSSNNNTGSNQPTGRQPGAGADEFPPPEPRPDVTPPEVPFSWDAVLFNIPEEKLVRAKVQPGASTTQVSEETPLRSGAEIETTDAPARIVLKNGTDMIRVAPHTKLSLAVSTPERVEIELLSGTVWADVSGGNPNRPFIIHVSNGAIISNQGVFRVADALDRGYHVAAIEGTAEVVSRKAQIRVLLNGGEMLTMSPSGVIGETRAVARIVEHEDWKFADLGADWWLRADRLGVDRESGDEETEVVSMNELRSYVRNVGTAYLKFAQDTGHVPTREEAFSVLRQNRGNWQGWQGPYWEGVLPPLDSWGRPLRYTTRQTQDDGSMVGIVYSMGEDYIDNNGDPSADIPELILYYQLDNIAQRQN